MVENLKLIDSIYSPYNRIDVLDDEKNNRYFFIDGIFYFDSKNLEDFNLYLTEIPIHVKKNVSDVLIIGGGTLSSAFHVSKYVSNLTVVELDPGVIFTASKYFKKFNHFDNLINKTKIVIDDGKHYLMNVNKKFDVIIVDVPYPWSIQTTLLYTTDFYEMVKSKLREDGIFVTHLSGSIEGNEIATRVPKRIVKSISQIFPNYIIYSFENLIPEFIIANDDKFSKNTIYDAINELGIREKFSILEKKEIDEIINSSNPITFLNLDAVITESLLMIR
jgi:spermidine synthase